MAQNHVDLEAPGTKVPAGPAAQEMQQAIEVARRFVRIHSAGSHEAVLARQFLRLAGLSEV